MPPFRNYHRTRLASASASALAVTMLIVSACTQAPPANGTLKGTFTAVGGASTAPSPPPIPLDGTITATRGTTVVASTRAIGGSFTLTLPPGTYTITGLAPYEHGTACTTTSKVTSDTTSPVEVVCYNA